MREFKVAAIATVSFAKVAEAAVVHVYFRAAVTIGFP
jgi:hypothetical protein